MVTDSNVDYEGSITIPLDLMQAVDLWIGEKVLVASIDGGARLETYVQPGPVGSKTITINGGAARLIGKGERVTIMAYGLSKELITAKRIICNENNEVIEGLTNAD